MRRLVLLVAAGTLAAGSAAWAGSHKSHSIHVILDTPMIVSGKALPAGDYSLSWMGEAPKVDVTFKRDAKVVAEASAKVEQLPQPSREEEVISRSLKDGKQALEEVRLRNQKTALVFSAS